MDSTSDSRPSRQSSNKTIYPERSRRLQIISYYHPVDFIKSLAVAYEKEQSPAARDAIAQILINSRMCAEGHRPICQDTGIVTVFLKIGMNVQWDATMSIEDMVNAGVDWFITGRLFLRPIVVEYLHDPFQNFAERWTFGRMKFGRS